LIYSALIVDILISSLLSDKSIDVMNDFSGNHIKNGDAET